MEIGMVHGPRFGLTFVSTLLPRLLLARVVGVEEAARVVVVVVAGAAAVAVFNVDVPSFKCRGANGGVWSVCRIGVDTGVGVAL